MTPRRFWLLFALAVIVRLPALLDWRNLYWYDEAFSAVAASLPTEQAWQFIAGDVHPPLWYIVVSPFMAVFGRDAEWALRFPAFLFSLLSVWLLWRVAVESRWPVQAGEVAVSLMAVLPFQVYYAGEGRMYAMLQALVLGAVLVIIRGHTWALFYPVFLILFTHNYGLFYVCCLYVFAVYGVYTRSGFDKRRMINITLAFASAGVLYALVWFAPVTLTQIKLIETGYWIQPLHLGQLVQNIYFLVIGFAVSPAVLPFGLITVTGVLVWLTLRGVQDCKHAPDMALPFVVMLLGPALLAQIVSELVRPVFLFRGLIASVPFAYLLAGWVVVRVGRWERVVIGAGMAIIAAFGLARMVVEPPKYNSQWFIDGVQYVRDNWREGDIVVHSTTATTIAWSVYGDDIPQAVMERCYQVSDHGGLSAMTFDAMDIPDIPTSELLQRRVWLMVGTGPLTDPCVEPVVLPILERSEPVSVEMVNDMSISGLWLYTPGNGKSWDVEQARAGEDNTCGR